MQSETSLLHQALYLWVQSIKVKYELQTATNLKIRLRKLHLYKGMQRQQVSIVQYMKKQNELFAETELIKDHMVENIVYPEAK